MTVDVYLDNQDLSRMFKPENAAQQAITDELLQLKNDGIARYMFSIWHVFEFIKKPDPGYERQHRLKAKFLFDLCEYNALPFHDDIVRNDNTYADKAIWLPRSAVAKITLNFRSSFKKTVESREGLNRKQRRTLNSTAAMRMIQKNTINVERYVEKNLPLTKKFKTEQSLTKFIRGEISEGEFSARIAELFCSPPMFYDQWYEDSDREYLLSDICNKMGAALVEALQRAKTVLPLLVDARKKMKEVRADYYDAKRKVQEFGLTPDFDESIFKSVTASDPRKILSEIEVENGFEYLRHYFWKTANGAPYKLNDATDLLHLFYINHVDLIRCDGAMFEVMKDCKEFDASKIVSKFSQLPERIRLAAAD